MLRLALSNFLQDRTRLLFSVGGVGLALTLVLFFDAIFAGFSGRLTVYIDRAGADVWVSQEGVRTMHMSVSSLPAAMVEKVREVPGVQEVEPILYASSMIQTEGNEYLAYTFGVDPGASMGVASHVVRGSSMPGPGEVIIDDAIAARAGVDVGDNVAVLGRSMRIAGLTSGTSSMVSSVAILRKDDFARGRGSDEVVSFILVRVETGESAEGVAERIRRQVEGVTVQTSGEFAARERGIVKEMGADIVNIMNSAGYVTGLAVVVLTVYIATVARRREYGVLKAMGVRTGRLYQVVIFQALLSVALGLAFGLGLTLLLSALIPRMNELMVLSVTAGSVFRVAAVAVILAGFAAFVPARQIAGLEPVTVLRRG